MSGAKLTRAQLIEAAKSLSPFCGDPPNVMRVVPPHEGSKEDYAFIEKMSWDAAERYQWFVIWNETCVAPGRSDGDVVMRALVLEALQR